MAERKSDMTRRRIMDAATELMAERGGAVFQMAEVSERCGLSKGSVYYYFADKAALVRAIFSSSMEELVASVEGAVAQAPSAMAAVEGLVGVMARAVRPGSPITLALTGGTVDTAREILPLVEKQLAHIIDILAAQLERAKGEGLVRPDADTELVASAIIGAFAVCEYASPGRLSTSDDAFVRGVLALVFKGIGTDAGRICY